VRKSSIAMLRSLAAHLPSIAWRSVVLVGRDRTVADAAGRIRVNRGQLSGEQSRPDLCEHLRQPGTAVAGDLPGCDDVDELVVGEDLLEQPAHISLATRA
jgi:hypothetical protein